jgi:GTPase SAR1 family protein
LAASGELDQLERAVRAGLNTVVVGGRGVGSTSLVHALVRRLRDDDAPVATVVLCGGAQSVVAVLTRVVLALAVTAPVAVAPANTATGLLWQLAHAVHHGTAGGVVLVVDDLPPDLGRSCSLSRR